MFRHLEKTGRTLLPMDSGEALWEWHIPSDRLFWTRGACLALGVKREEAPSSMADFLSFIPQSVLPRMNALRESVLNGLAGSSVSCRYIYRKCCVQERMVVVQRDDMGRAVLAVGHYTVTGFDEDTAVEEEGRSRLTGAGFWLCSRKENTVSMDCNCASLLGYAAVTQIQDLDSWRKHLHPEYTENTPCRYQLIFDQEEVGDSLDDLLQVRRVDGNSAALILRGSVLQRDEFGHASVIAGFLQPVSDSPAFDDAARLLLTVNSTGDGLWDWDTQRQEMYYSPRFLAMLGYGPDDFSHDPQDWLTKLHADDAHKIIPALRDIVDSQRYGDTFECTYRLRHKDGAWVWVLGRGYVTHRDAEGRAMRVVGMHTNITSVQNEREQLEERIRNDALTGLRSRTFCDLEMERIEQSGVRPVSVIVGDICGLKIVNDNLGHAMGDKLLRRAAQMLRFPLRATDCVARVGGDEFVILLSGCPENKARDLCTQLEEHIGERNAADSELPVFISLGVAGTDSLEEPVAQLLKRADHAMLEVKIEQRPRSHKHIKEWIESHKQITVSLQDERCS